MKITREMVVEALKSVKDPEVHIDIWTMGLIYDIKITSSKIWILMTYTTPFCPWGPQLNEEVISSLKNIGATEVKIELTFDPPYKMPSDLRATLGI